ncbi:Membrane protein involved in the export of O-antigen and teichoic acid [Filimonas lacunae]|uniref:Membrane protein involved in the export of O-antigen and teichoic acid n=1 Tax=Filimonas lacunae TaxID=477680 RepID=A0A173MDD5_9BACT|nr:oligosaccharide flippase family protein [Filimonas lacunae]BAV05575.1 membrane protein [Filimonas lacunae]SIT29318.1 Membrane protein involved in the export of O-antigen and teichoic acid [Filimonas lacunae]
MQKKLFKNISANILQQIANQLFSLVIFYVLSRQLSKPGFGQLNGCLALLLICFSILSFGLDQLTVKKIAAGESPSTIVSLYMIHILGMGALFYSLLAMIWLLFPAQPLLPVIFLLSLGKFQSFIATPYKQVTAGREQFSTLAGMSIVSNVVKGIALVIAQALHSIQLHTVIVLFILGDTAELLCTLYLYHRHSIQSIRFVPDKKAYSLLLREALPQLGIVICTAILSRFDWLLLGIAVSDTQLAEYSFAYKVYEIITLPLLAIAPLLIPRFVQHYQQQRKDLSGIYAILRLEMLIASFLIVITNMLWTPLVDLVTAGKYGAVNSNTILILTFCTPLLYVSNVLWTSGFAQHRLQGLLAVIAITCAVNIAGNCLLIPLLQKEGAALACLLSLLVQTVLYFRQDRQIRFARVSYAIVCHPLCALTSIILVRLTPLAFIPALAAAIILYILLASLCGLRTKKEFSLVSHFLTADT